MKNRPHKIRWGILGLGGIAHKFATDLATVEGAELWAVASRSKQKATEFANTFQANTAYDSYDALVKDPAVDAIYIATPHSFHKAHTLLCLQHNKAVLCEKPFAMNSDEVAEMIAAAKAHKVLLMEALWTYFLPHYQYVLQLINEQEFGKLLTLQADFGFKAALNFEGRLLKKELGGGSLLDIGIYPIFAALSSLGKPKAIDAHATFFENGVDSSCTMRFEYDNAQALLKSSLLEETPTEAIFTFEKATVKIEGSFHEPSRVILTKAGKSEVIDFNTQTMGYNFEILHFNQLLRDQKRESDLMSFEFSKNLMEILDRTRQIIGLSY